MTRQNGRADQPKFEDVCYGNAVEARSVDFRTQQRGYKHHYADALEKKKEYYWRIKQQMHFKVYFLVVIWKMYWKYQNLIFGNLISHECGEYSNNGTYPHGKIITPRQEHDARVVLFDMSEIEIEKHVPNNKEHANWWQINWAKQWEYIDGYKGSRIGVQSMIEELAQWPTCPRTTRLLAIHAICIRYISSGLHRDWE